LCPGTEHDLPQALCFSIYQIRHTIVAVLVSLLRFP
jgi:hypothetical protein